MLDVLPFVLLDLYLLDGVVYALGCGRLVRLVGVSGPGVANAMLDFEEPLVAMEDVDDDICGCTIVCVSGGLG